MNIQDCINDVALFNEIAGNFSQVTHESLISQSRVVREEGLELFEAVEEGNANEILKEAVDVLVTIHGFVKMLEEQGYDVIGAFNAVNKNNLSKFSTETHIVRQSLDYYDDQGIKITAEENNDYEVYVLKNEFGKVVKPVNYKKVNVAAYTPKGIMPKLSLPEIGDDR